MPNLYRTLVRLMITISVTLTIRLITCSQWLAQTVERKDQSMSHFCKSKQFTRMSLNFERLSIILEPWSPRCNLSTGVSKDTKARRLVQRHSRKQSSDCHFCYPLWEVCKPFPLTSISGESVPNKRVCCFIF